MHKLQVTIDGQTFEVETGTLLPGDSAIEVKVNGETVRVTLPDVEAMRWLLVDERPYELDFDRDLRWLRARGALHTLDVRDLLAGASRPTSGDGRVKAPIPGLITRLLVEAGQPVSAGQPVVMLEAMKMENEIRAPRGGTVRSVQASKGQSVVKGQVLLEIE